MKRTLHASRPGLRRATLGAVLAVALAACGGAGKDGGAQPPPPPPAPTLQSLAIGNGRAYAAVGIPQRLSVTGWYSDGGTAAITSDVAWTSSDDAVATVDETGLVIPWAKGTARITATHRASGLAAVVDVTSRAVVGLRADAGAAAGAECVDTTTSYFRVSGLTPGAIYTVSASGMSDDVDLQVFSDASMSLDAQLCASGAAGTIAESCEARANAFGEVWVAVDGEWTAAGATFTLDVRGAPPVSPAATFAFPGDLPHQGSVGPTRRYYEIAGLRPGVAYEVRLSGLTADLDLEVYADRYRFHSLCESYLGGTVDDACTSTAEGTSLFVEIDGETTREGGSFTLTVTAR